MLGHGFLLLCARAESVLEAAGRSSLHQSKSFIQSGLPPPFPAAGLGSLGALAGAFLVGELVLAAGRAPSGPKSDIQSGCDDVAAARGGLGCCGVRDGGGAGVWDGWAGVRGVQCVCMAEATP